MRRTKVLWALTLGLAAAYVLMLVLESTLQAYFVEPGSTVAPVVQLAVAIASIAGPGLMLLLGASALLAALALAATRAWGGALIYLLILLAAWPAHLTSVRPADAVRLRGFERFAAELNPLLQAVTDESLARGAPLTSLDEVRSDAVTKARQATPRACRDLRYRVLDSGNLGAWEISFDCGWRGWAQLDHFYYRSSGQYPDDPNAEPVGRWRYVWD